MMLPEITSLNAEELEELKKVNDETISGLKNDIKLLKWQLKQFGPSAELSSEYEAHARRYAGPTVSDELIDKIQQEIAEMNSKLQETKNLTSISIETISREVLQLDEAFSKIRFELTLKVLGKTMYLTYEIDEMNGDEACNVGGRVTFMEIQIDKETNKVIGGALTKTIEEVSVQPAMCLIKSYLKFVSERESLIQHFVQEYPESVTYSIQNDIPCLDISDHNPKQPIFGIEWTIKYKTDSLLVPQVNLRVKASQDMKDMDRQGVLKSAPDMFVSLIAEKGLKSAIDCIIRLLSSDEQASFLATPM